MEWIWRLDGEIGTENWTGVGVFGGVGGGRKESRYAVGGVCESRGSEAGESIGHVGCCVCGLQGGG